MGIAYIVIGVLLGLYWKSRSIYFGYSGLDANHMRGSTILVSIIIWPVILFMYIFLRQKESSETDLRAKDLESQMEILAKNHDIELKKLEQADMDPVAKVKAMTEIGDKFREDMADIQGQIMREMLKNK